MAISSQGREESRQGSTTRARSPERTVKPHERAAIRLCSKCKQNQIFSTSTWCSACRSASDKERREADPAYREKSIAKCRAYYGRNRLKLLAQKSEYGKLVAERDKARRRERYATEPEFREKSKARRDRYYAANAPVYRARDARNRAARVLATPAWADAKKIRDVYKAAAMVTAATGVRHEVDHIVPIKGRKVSGLHVHFNLRVVPITENRRKFNKLVEDIV